MSINSYFRVENGTLLGTAFPDKLAVTKTLALDSEKMYVRNDPPFNSNKQQFAPTITQNKRS